MLAPKQAKHLVENRVSTLLYDHHQLQAQKVLMVQLRLCRDGICLADLVDCRHL